MSPLASLKLSILREDIPVSIRCGDEDLDDFFQNEAVRFQKELLSKTYCWLDGERVLAAASVLNDKIDLKHRKDKKFARDKHLPSYPAVKIARLGVDKSCQGSGLGKQILTFLKLFFLVRNKTGCRFLTVDAYNRPEVIGFYLKCGFFILNQKDEKEPTRTMYFDLAPLNHSLRENQDLLTATAKELQKLEL